MTKTVNYYKRTGQKDSRARLNLRLINAGLFISLAALAFIYLIGISDLTAKGFILQDLRMENNELEERWAFYEQQVNSLQSSTSLAEQVKSLNMVAIEDIEYIKVGTNAVAKK